MLWLWFVWGNLTCVARGHRPYRPRFSSVWCRRCGKMM